MAGLNRLRKNPSKLSFRSRHAGEESRSEYSRRSARFLVGRRGDLLGMTGQASLSAACKAPPLPVRGEKFRLTGLDRLESTMDALGPRSERPVTLLGGQGEICCQSCGDGPEGIEHESPSARLA